MYQPYQMPYGQQYQPMQQMFTPSMPTQAPIQQSGIMGHMVGSHEEIKPNDVPMNGTAAYFPTQDGSVIYAKAWNPDGSITTVRYLPAVDTQSNDAQAPTLVDVMDQLSDIQDLIKAARKPATTKRTTAKKEDADDTSD